MTDEQEEKRAAFEKLVAKGMDKRDASLMTGYAPNHQIDKPSKKIAKALEKKGVTDDRLAEVIRDGLEAKNRFGTTDHNAVTKYLGIAGKWLGYEKDSLNVQVGLNVQGQVQDAAQLGEAIKIIEAEVVSRGENETKQTGSEGETAS